MTKVKPTSTRKCKKAKIEIKGQRCWKTYIYAIRSIQIFWVWYRINTITTTATAGIEREKNTALEWNNLKELKWKDKSEYNEVIVEMDFFKKKNFVFVVNKSLGKNYRLN